MKRAEPRPASPLQKRRQPGPPTAKDGYLASDEITLRKLLLQAPEVRAWFDELDAVRPRDHASMWSPRAALRYHAALDRAEHALDYAWSQDELDRIVARWSLRGHYGAEWADLPYRDQVADGLGLVGVGYMAGRPDGKTGRARGWFQFSSRWSQGQSRFTPPARRGRMQTKRLARSTTRLRVTSLATASDCGIVSPTRR